MSVNFLTNVLIAAVNGIQNSTSNDEDVPKENGVEDDSDVPTSSANKNESEEEAVKNEVKQNGEAEGSSAHIFDRPRSCSERSVHPHRHSVDAVPSTKISEDFR